MGQLSVPFSACPLPQREEATLSSPSHRASFGGRSGRAIIWASLPLQSPVKTEVVGMEELCPLHHDPHSSPVGDKAACVGLCPLLQFICTANLADSAVGLVLDLLP